MLSLYEFVASDSCIIMYKMEKIGDLYLIIWYYTNQNELIFFDLWNFCYYLVKNESNSKIKTSDISLIAAYATGFLGRRPVFRLQRYNDIMWDFCSLDIFVKNLASAREQAKIKHEDK